MTDDFNQSFITQSHCVGSNRIKKIPCDITCLVHSSKFCHSISRGVIIDDLHTRIHLHVGIMVGLLLACGVSTAPGYDDQFNCRDRQSQSQDHCKPGQGSNAFRDE